MFCLSRVSGRLVFGVDFFFCVRVPVESAGRGRGAGAREVSVSLRCFDYNAGTGREERATHPRHLANYVCLSFRTRISRLLSSCRRRDVGAEEEEEKAVGTADRRAGDQATGASTCPFLRLEYHAARARATRGG